MFSIVGIGKNRSNGNNLLKKKTLEFYVKCFHFDDFFPIQTKKPIITISKKMLFEKH